MSDWLFFRWLMQIYGWIKRAIKKADSYPYDNNDSGGHRLRLLEISTSMNETQLQYNSRLESKVEILETRLERCETRHEERDVEVIEMKREIDKLKAIAGTDSNETLRGRIKNPIDSPDTPK